MIKFSRKEDYAIILVNKLAIEYKNRLVSLTEIAKEYNISLFFLRNLVTTLRSTGLIRATEGKKGGYSLTKDPEKIKMGEFLHIFTDKSELTCCSENKRICPQQNKCIAGNTWRKLNKEFIDKVYDLTLTDFMTYNK